MYCQHSNSGIAHREKYANKVSLAQKWRAPIAMVGLHRIFGHDSHFSRGLT
jgi:hypothetical protein